MLAYVFWHWSQQHIAATDYEAGLVGFHRSLATNQPQGFRQSLAFRLDALPWKEPQTVGYEDWYLVEDFAALGALNTAATSGHNCPPHDRVAHTAAGGAGGLYRLQHGALDLAEARFAAWLSKPAGVHYVDFDARLRAWTAGMPVSSWQRQMVLGPAPEYCIFTRNHLRLPEDAAALNSVHHVVTAGGTVI